MLKLTTCLLIFLFSFNQLFAADIPIIVIAPSKKAQSISTVGSTTTVFDESYFENPILHQIREIHSHSAERL